jgi:hypothetical protein
MKIPKLFLIAFVLFLSSLAQAQVSVNVNIGAPPAWAPVGYAETEYYYIPDLEAYYDVRQTQFIYFGNGRWIRSRNLPRQYRNYDLYGGYKVVLHDYHGSRPYNNFKNHKIKYYKGYNGKNNNNHKVYVVKGHHNEGGNYKKNGKDHKHKD